MRTVNEIKFNAPYKQIVDGRHAVFDKESGGKKSRVVGLGVKHFKITASL